MTHSAAGCQEKKKGNELHVGVAVNLFFLQLSLKSENVYTVHYTCAAPALCGR